MLHLLLLDSATSTVTLTSLLGVYIALGATVTAAGISAWASINASRRAASTAERVTTLTTQTTEKVAALSAQVTRESSTLAARTAQELKDKDYKNDFHKRIIERRLKAWEKAEELMGILAPGYIDRADNKSYFTYFHSAKEFNLVYDMIRSSIVTQALWMGKEYTDALKSLHNQLIDIKGHSYKMPYIEEDGRFTLDDALIMQGGKENFLTLKTSFKNLLRILSVQVQEIHNVEAFFSQLPKVSLYNDEIQEISSPLSEI